eukprot:TRINITY_DN1505_c0_g1_i2.p1 TRINITY_DN1505_c0_g1~~TRINITY_DN1505_c0_g1_i2.p1  ORF type:complete len:213 (-),score=42.95 TRINITY_DN1505_c0_g1_i2:322-960(-)
MESGGRVQRVLVVVAMTHEALPIISKLSLQKVEGEKFLGSMVAYKGTVGTGEVFVITNGVANVYEEDGQPRKKDGEFVQVERVSVTPASITTWEGIRRYSPDIVISAGTAGGVQRLGAVKRRVYVTQTPVKYFDRLIDFRAPGDDFAVTNYKCYGVGSYSPLACPNMMKDLQLHEGSVGTGSSFSLPEGLVKEQFDKGAALLKDMEAASVAG